jgi:transketolase
MAHAANAVHVACAFSLIEILSVLHRHFLRYPDNAPDAADRDHLVLSKGHGVMALYACMVDLGWLSESELEAYLDDGTRLMGLSDSRVPGLEVTSGSLGHGFSVGVGLAFAAARRGTDQRTFVIVGDGEMNEGPIWEGMLFASHHRLHRLVVIVDENRFQAMGRTSEILDLGNLSSKFDAFGFETRTVDGHDPEALRSVIGELLDSSSPRPKAVVARTIKGRGVSFMEDRNDWHYTRLDDETLARALDELLSGEGS